jgi:squalene synthase HpnC
VVDGSRTQVLPPAGPAEAVVLPASARKQAEGENFPVALRVLPRRLRRGLVALYDYARYVDDLGDEFDGDRPAALARAAEIVRGGETGPDVPGPLAGAAVLREDYGVATEELLNLVQANIIDQQVSRYGTFDDLLDYCRLSANPVGRAVLAIAGAGGEERIELSDRICTGLQIIEHIQDVGEDFRAGRVYLPQTDLRRFAVTDAMLAGPNASRSLQDVIRYETDRAVAYLEAGAPLVSSLHGWPRIAVSAFLAGGRAAADTVRRAGYDVLGHDCSPPKRAVARAYLRATVRTPG